MPAFHHVGICVDYSEASEKAVQLGRALAGKGTTLSVVNAVASPMVHRVLEVMGLEQFDPMDNARERVESMARGTGASPVVLEGRPAPAVVEWAERESVDLLVAAEHGGLVERATTGSFTTHLAYHSPCSVAIARTDDGNVTEDGFSHVVACVDDSDAALGSLDLAAALATEFGARLTIIHSVASLAHVDPRFSRYYETIRESAQQLVDHLGSQYDAQAVLVDGHPGSSISHWAKENEADLLVAAAHRDVSQRALLGSFAGFLAHHAPCPVVLTRPSPSADGFLLT